MSKSSDPLAWVARFDIDYSLARAALRHKPPLCYGVCFHTQQCAEKYLKAILVSRSKRFPKTHDLVHLHDLCDKAGVLIGMKVDHLSILSSYAVRIRYPGADPTLDEARKAVEYVKVVRRFARKWFGLK